jgi:hypothetical protein
MKLTTNIEHCERVELYLHSLGLKAGCSNDDGVSAEVAASYRMVKFAVPLNAVNTGSCAGASSM